MVATGGLMHSLNNRPTGLELDDAAEIARIYQRHQLARRVRRVSRIAIIAAKNDLSSRQRRLLSWQRSYRNAIYQLRANQYRIAAACAVLVFGISTIVPSFLQADTSKSTTLDAQVKALIGDSRDDASKYLTFDSKKSAYVFAVPETKKADSSEHTGRNADAYTTDMPVNARDGLTVTDTNTKIAVTLKPEFYMTPARKTDGNNLVYRSGNKQVIYTHKYNGLKEDIVLTAYQDSTMSFTFTLRLPSGVEARLDKQGNIGIYSSDPTLFGNISFDKEQDRLSVEKAREKSEKNNLVMTIPYPIVKDSTGTEYSDRAKFTLSDKRITKSSVDTSSLPAEVVKTSTGQTQLNEYTLTLRADNLKNLTYPISIDPTMQVRDAAEFGKLNIESGADLNTTNSLIKRGGLTGGGLVSWASNTTHLPYSAQKHGATIYNGNLYIHGGLTATGNDFRVYYASIDTATGTIGAFNPASGVVGAGRSTHAIFAYNGFFYIVGNGAAGGTGPTSYAKINSDGTLGTFAATTNQIIGRRFASYSLVNGYIYVAGGCTAFSSAVDTGDCTAFASTVEYAQIKPDGSLTAWQNTSAFSGNRMLGSMTTYNGTLYYAGGEDDGDLINNGVSYNTVFYAKQNSDGTLSAWQTNTMPGAKQSHQSIAYNGYIYEVGGYNAVVYYAPLYGDGSIGSWITDTPLPDQYAIGVLLAANNNLFLVGGSSPSTGDEILVASVQPPGTVLPFTNATSLGTARYYNTVTVYNGYIYVTGGCTDSGGTYNACTPTTSVEFAKINSSGSLGSWSTTTALPAARNSHAAAVFNGYLYLTGGCKIILAVQNCNQGDTVYAQINVNNGTVGSWTTDTTNTFAVRREHVSVAYNGFLYVIDGHNGGPISDVSYTTLASNGSIGAWSTTTSTGLGNLSGAVVYRNVIYVLNNGFIKYASPASNGTISTWQSVTTPFSGNRYSIAASNGYLYIHSGTQNYFASIGSSGTPGTFNATQSNASAHDGNHVQVAYAGYLYLIAGCSAQSGSNCNGPNTVNEYAAINNGGTGTTTAWTTDSSNTPTTRGNNQTEVLNGYIYVIGGCTSGTQFTCTPVGSVEYAPINTDGSIGTYTSTSAIVARKGFASVVYNGRIYVLGGVTNSGSTTYTRTIQFATPTNTGSITSWTTNTIDLPNDITAFSVAAYDGYIYRVGGGNVTTSTAYAAITSSTGQVGSWTTGTTPALNVQGNALTAYRGYIYSVNGNTGSNTTNAVQYAHINTSTHAPETWQIAGARTAIDRQGHTTFAYNGFLYSVAGHSPNNSTSASTIEYAPISDNGELGQWQLSGALLSVNHYYGSSNCVWNGRIYLVTGLNGSNLSSDQEYATLKTMPRTGNFSRLYDFDVGVRPTSLITRGTKQTGAEFGLTYSSSSNMANALDNTQTVPDVVLRGNGQSINLGTNRTLSRYLFARYQIDDTSSGVFPDIGNESTITDFDMYYTSNPGTRLRGGRTFTNGVDRGLEANPQ